MKMLKHARNKGAVLLTTMCMLLVLVGVAAGMLELMSQQYKMSVQTVAWNQAAFTAEAGVDLAWNEINKLTGINTNGGFMSGWTQSGTTFTRSSQTLSPLGGIDGTSSYTITVNTNFTVTSIAGSPTNIANGMRITAVGNKATAMLSTNVTRTIEVDIVPGSLTAPNSDTNSGGLVIFGMLAKGLVDFNGNAAFIDSFNSTLTGSSSWRGTGDRRQFGNVGTNGQLIDAAGLDIYGSMRTGPGGSVSTDPGFRMFHPTSGATNTIKYDLEVSIPDAALPANFSASSSLGNVTTATTITANGTGTTKQVQASSVNLSGNGKILTISGSGKVQLYVTGSIAMAGQSSITLNPTSPGSLQVEVYVAGSADLSGNGVINPTSFAKDFVLFGLPSCTSVTVNGTADFKGVVYAPSAHVSLAGNARVDGAVVGNSIAAVGTVDFHYDEALNNFMSGQITDESGDTMVLGYQIANWKEK
jgi:Tfp pilus assembly protein PilX